MAYSERQKQTTMKYIQDNLEEIRFRVRKGERDALVEAATKAGYSAYSRFVIDAVNEKAGSSILTMPSERGSKRKAEDK